MNEPAIGHRPLSVLLAPVPLVLAIVAEACWLAVLAGPLNAYAHLPPVLDLVAAVCFVIGGLVISRLMGRRLGRRWPEIALGLSLLAAVLGVALAPAARDAVAAGGINAIGPALAANPGGLLAGVGLLRGIGWGHTSLPLPEDRLVRLLGGGSVAITFAAVVGALTLEPWRSAFLASTLFLGLVFAGGATLALAFTRQAIAAGGMAAGWQRNPAWVVTMLIAVVALVTLTIAFSGQLRPTIEIVVALLLAPMTVIGLLVGWSKRGLRVFVMALVVMVILASFSGAVIQGQLGDQSATGGGGEQASPVDTAVSIGIGGGVLIVVVVLVLVLVRLWMGRAREDSDDVVEERYVDRTPEADARVHRRPRLALARAPTDAVAAYRQLLADLAQRRGVRREQWETPREHARRLRVNGNSGLSLDLLAADYALAAFGDRQLSAIENGRAVGRWRLLRRRLRAQTEPADELDSEPTRRV